jgi:cytochrome P450
MNQDLGAPVSRPTTRAGFFEPPTGLAELRERRPLCPLRYPDGHVGWLVTSYALARRVLADPRFSMFPLRRAVGPAMEESRRHRGIPGALLHMDPPQHTQVRRMNAGYFTVHRVGEHRGAVQRIVADCLDAMEKAGPPVDLVTMFARPVTELLLCELMAIPSSERHLIQRLTAVDTDENASQEVRDANRLEFLAYCHGVIRSKRAEPADDLLSDLIRRDELTDDELAGTAMTLFEAGHETTATMFSFGVFALLTHRSNWEALRATPSLIDAAVEELLRYLSIFPDSFTRTAVDDVELDGVVVRAGQSVTVSLAAANHDPERFPNPERLDLTRDAKGHVGFGQGRHMCIGQHLARLELRIGLGELIRRFPTLRLAVPTAEIPFYGDERVIYGVRRLPVTWKGDEHADRR